MQPGRKFCAAKLQSDLAQVRLGSPQDFPVTLTKSK
jgi:ankyrin repeat protein